MTVQQLKASGQKCLSVVMAVPVSQWQFVLSALLVIWLVVSLAPLPWLLLPSEPKPAADLDQLLLIPGPSSRAPSSQADPVDLAKLQAMDLFGSADPAQAQQAAPVADTVEFNAEKTRLQIQLMGIVAASDSANALAIIAYQNQQDRYAIGDTLPVGNRVTLAKVLVDHVIINNGGNYESVWLYEDSGQAASNSVSSAARAAPERRPVGAVNDMRGKRAATALAEDYRQRLYKNPGSLAEVVRVSPAMQDGQMRGYSVSPGRDKAQFDALGFQAGDIVTSINDISLENPQQAVEIYKMMRKATEAVFTVERAGQSLQIMVSLDSDHEE